MKKYLLVIFCISTTIKFGISIQCPDECICTWISANLKADCSNLGLSDIPNFGDVPIEILDLSNNLLNRFPSELSQIKTLTTLDLTGNRISQLNSNALNGFTSLTTLFLDNNDIDNWRDINPNSILLSAINLQTLSLAGNPLKSFSSNSEHFLLMSNSLKILDLTNCKISTIGRQVLQGLTALERLILDLNPIKHFSSFTSNSLKMLDMSNCSLTKIHQNIVLDLPQLIFLNLSRNSGMSLITKSEENIESNPLKGLDLSFCNMDSIDLSRFSNLTFLTLKGNMLKKLTENSFASNKLLENLIISHNNINEIELDTFNPLKYLRSLDLSYNSISRLNRNIFINNEMLTVVNLSKNTISRFSRITAISLVRINLSGSEILTIEENALADMPKLLELDLSHNLISHLPKGFASKSLQILNLNMCRLTSIRNTTFQNFSELSILSLSGNRFTTPFRIEYFKSNPFLYQLWLGDNPWRCECEDKSFLQFYLFITQRPSKIMDKNQMKCASPDEFYGKVWDQVCFPVWFPNRNISFTEKIWSIIMVTIIVLSITLCTFVTLKRYFEKRKRRRNARELRQNLEEQREIMRNNRIMLEQQAQLNAPDPRETLPPCYEEALLMPKLDKLGSKSMVNLSNMKSKQKSTNKNEYENVDLISSTRRVFSEEMLSIRDRERTFQMNTTRRTGQLEPNRADYLQMNETKFVSSYLKSQNLQSAEEIANFQSYENSPYSRRKPKSKLHKDYSFPSVSIDPEIHDTRTKRTSYSKRAKVISSYESIPRSPYARRELKNLNEGQPSISQWTLSSDIEDKPLPQPSGSLNIIEGHYSRPLSTASSSSGFQIMDHDNSIVSSLRDEPSIIVHRRNSEDSNK